VAKISDELAPSFFVAVKKACLPRFIYWSTSTILLAHSGRSQVLPLFSVGIGKNGLATKTNGFAHTVTKATHVLKKRSKCSPTRTFYSAKVTHFWVTYVIMYINRLHKRQNFAQSGHHDRQLDGTDFRLALTVFFLSYRQLANM
jgi:hypothetical protein